MSVIPAGQLARRHAFTLVELLISLVLAVLTAGIAVAILTGQQQLALGLDAMVEVSGRVRDGRDILVAAVRAADVGDTIWLASDTAIEFFTTLGASTVCAPPAGPGGLTLFLPPDTLAAGNTLTAWLDTPDTGDYALLFHDSSAVAPAGWERFRIASVTRAPVVTTCPPSSGFTTSGDIVAGARAYVITLATPPSVPVRMGAPVRVVRRGRYSVYRSGPGSQWYLGYRRCNAVDGVCGGIQPVSGPYHAGGGGPPLGFRYYARDGREVTGTGPTTRVARIDIATRGMSGGSLRLPGFPRTPFDDSALGSIALHTQE